MKLKITFNFLKKKYLFFKWCLRLHNFAGRYSTKIERTKMK